ncbi:MAG: RNase adapter RapZ [Nitriliruptoraceae bacterium]
MSAPDAPDAGPLAPGAVPVPPTVLVITGLSGAGRSTASDALEDLGWFVIDNLPPALIRPVADLAAAPGSSVSRLALVTDVRGREFFPALQGAIAELRAAGTDVRIVFLEADDDVLVRRFTETRRRHPADTGEGLLAGIASERRLLAALREDADLVVDTSRTNVHDLRDRIVGLLSGSTSTALQVNVVSFGFKRGAPREADLLVDGRFRPTPHWIAELRPLTGLDEAVRDHVMADPATGPFLARLVELLDVVMPGYRAEGKHYLTLAIGCTGGKHRSVAVAEHVAAHLTRDPALAVRVVHRDLGAE